jgi:hypothetical protein
MNQTNLDAALLPEEAARFLGISMQKLSRLRRNGKVKGTQVGKANLYTYKISDLRQANLELEKRGPKPKKTKPSESQ